MSKPSTSRSLVADLLALTGVGLAVYGLWLWYEPLAWIAGGLLLILVAISVLRR